MNGFRPQLTPLEDRALASVTPALVTPALAAPPAAASTTPALVAPAALSTAPAPVATAVRAVLEAARAEYGLPAMAGGFITGGQVTGVAAAGVREAGKPTPVTAADQFHLGSNGKAITSTLAAVLVERGAIKWTSTVGDVFPELRGRMNPAYRGVTLEQLLCHRGGFLDENVDPALLDRVLAFKGNGYQARQAFLGDMLAVPPGPAGGYSYSNVGFAVAGAMMERAAGGPFEYLMQRYVFKPLGMTSAGFGPPGRGTRVPDQPRGHDEAGRSVGNGPASDAPAVLSPAGTMHMSMADWGKFLRAQLGERVNGVKLLTDASLTKLHTPDPRVIDEGGRQYQYGFGWVTVQTPLGPALWHNGSNGFWYSEALLVPSLKAGVFAVANEAGDSGTAGVEAALAGLQDRFLT